MTPRILRSPLVACLPVLGVSAAANARTFPANPAVDTLFRQWDRPGSPGLSATASTAA